MNRARAEREHAGGFTLVEILVVVAVVAVLIAVLLPALAGASKTAKMTASASNLRTIGAVFDMYATGEKDYPIDVPDRHGRTPMDFAEGVFLATHAAVPKPTTIALLEELLAEDATDAGATAGD